MLDEIATLLAIEGANRFKVRAFSNAARAIEGAGEDVAELARTGRLETLEGIGKATASVVRELVEEGRSRYYEDVRQRTPRGLLDLLAIPGLGAGRVRTLHEKLSIATLDDLERAAREGRVASLPGFGVRTQTTILEGIAHVRESMGRRRYADALELAGRLRAFITAQPGAPRAETAGELRRGRETVDGITIVVEADDRISEHVSNALHGLPGLADAEAEGRTIQGRLPDGIGLRVVFAPSSSFATTLLAETGSSEHIEALSHAAGERTLRLEASGLSRNSKRLETPEEADVYAALGLACVPPELRESGEEVDAARADTLPELVTYADLRGCFHCHTTWSDGRATVEEMAEAASARGWRYLGIADHSRYAGYAGGLSPDEVLEQLDEIDGWNERHGKRLWLFKGIEADILPDGTLDYADRPDLLERFDYVIASAHSALNLAEAEQTQRFLRVIENPYVTFLGHLTGRLLLARPGMKLDLPVLLEAVAERGIGIEINGDPNRMDMDWRHWGAARTLGIRSALNPDAHSISQLDYVHNAVTMARKGGLESRDIVNCWTLAEVRRYFAARRT